MLAQRDTQVASTTNTARTSLPEISGYHPLFQLQSTDGVGMADVEVEVRVRILLTELWISALASGSARRG